MRFAFAGLFLLLASPAFAAGVVPLGGDPIGPDSSTTDGNGAVPASQVGSDVSSSYLGQPGVAFTVDGLERLVKLRSIVTFVNRTGGPVRVPNHRFEAQIWTLENYLAGKPAVHHIQLGQPAGVEFHDRPDGSIIPAETFGAAGGGIPSEWPSYDFHWDLSAHSAFALPMPAGDYVLALTSTSAIDAEGEFLVGISHAPGGLRPMFFANALSPSGPDYYRSPCCACDVKWAMCLYVQEEPLEPVSTSSLWGPMHGIGVGEAASLLGSTLFGPLGGFSDGFPGGPSGGLGGFPSSSSGAPGGGRRDFQTGSSTFFPDFTPVRFLPEDSFLIGPPVFSSDTSSDSDGNKTPPSQTSPVPEPSSVVLLVLGALLFLAWRRRPRLAN